MFKKRIRFNDMIIFTLFTHCSGISYSTSYGTTTTGYGTTTTGYGTTGYGTTLDSTTTHDSTTITTSYSICIIYF